MPDGICALACYVPDRPVRDLQKLEAEVELLYDGGVPADAARDITGLLTGDSVVIQKRTKRKELADIDIRPMLHSLTVEEREESLLLHVVVAAQNPGMNPALLATAVETHLPALKPDFVRVRRLQLLDGEGNIFR